MTEAIIQIFLTGPGGLALIVPGVAWLLRNIIKRDLEREMASYKSELNLSYEHSLSLQDRRRKLYEEFSDSLEEMFETKDENKLSLKMNKLFGLLALYAPDDVYKSLKSSLEGDVIPNEVKPIVYSALRKSLFGADTKLKDEDLIKHITASYIDGPSNKNVKPSSLFESGKY